MADVFLSYASADRPRIAPLAKALTAAGFSVWWDRDIRAGTDFAEAIELELRAAKAVVVAWSESSVSSPWVRDEASLAREASKLVPLRLDATTPPMGFRQIQAIDFSRWRGDSLSAEFRSLATSLQRLVASDRAAPPRQATTPSVAGRIRSLFLRRRIALLALVALAAGSFAAWGLLTSNRRSDATTVTLGEVEIRPFVATPPDPERAALATSYTGAFRQRFAELGIRNSPAPAARKSAAPELILAGDLASQSGKNILSARIEDRESGAVLWSVRGVPTEGAAWESNLAAFALKCALRRRDPTLGTDVFSRFIYGCAHFLEQDFGELHAVAKGLYESAPNDANAIGFYAFAHAGIGWSAARSIAEHDRLVAEGGQLARRALQLDPKNADALFTMGFVVSDFEFAAQEKWWTEAIAADPDLGWALGRYANLLTTVGRIREGIDIGLRAQLHRRMIEVPAAQLLAAIGDMDEAHRQFNLVRPMDPEEVGRQELAVEVFYGDIDAAARTLRDRPALAGRDADCFSQILAARRRRPTDRARFAHDCAPAGDYSIRAYALAGDLDAAFGEMDSFLASGERFVPQIFWPEMHDFIRDRRFWPMAARLRLVDYWLDTGHWPDFCSERDLPFKCATEAAKARQLREPT